MSSNVSDLSEGVEHLRELLAKHGPLSPLEAHIGDDYACLMFPEETTDGASVFLHGEAEVLAPLFAAAINAAPGLLDEIARLKRATLSPPASPQGVSPSLVDRLYRSAFLLDALPRTTATVGLLREAAAALSHPLSGDPI